MSTATGVAAMSLDCILAFDGNTRLAVRRLGARAALPFLGSSRAEALERLAASFKVYSGPLERFSAEAGGQAYRIHVTQVEGPSSDPLIQFESIEQLAR